MFLLFLIFLLHLWLLFNLSQLRILILSKVFNRLSFDTLLLYKRLLRLFIWQLPRDFFLSIKYNIFDLFILFKIIKVLKLVELLPKNVLRDFLML